MKLLLCFGTRPEAIKMAPVIQALQDRNFQFKICVTAQHREMLDQVLKFFNIIPDYDLNLMKPGQSLNNLSAKMLEAMDEILTKENPDLVLVQGDTTTAFITALAAFNRKVKVGHIEAGLRTYDKLSPYPEEGNRQLISRLADIHFAPTEDAQLNLIKEGLSKNQVFFTGNTVVDALQHASHLLEGGFMNEDIEQLQQKIIPGRKIVLLTGHRRENFGSGLEEICDALLKISERKDVQVIFPVHLNPQVNKSVYKILSGRANILLTDPVDYPALLWLIKKCDLIISDSGGIQEEAPSFGKPIIVTRNSSERMEGVKAGYAFLTGTSKTKIFKKAEQLLNLPPKYSEVQNPYGDGNAAKRIVDRLEELEWE